jgi:hypothetical protein
VSISDHNFHFPRTNNVGIILCANRLIWHLYFLLNCLLNTLFIYKNEFSSLCELFILWTHIFICDICSVKLSPALCLSFPFFSWELNAGSCACRAEALLLSYSTSPLGDRVLLIAQKCFTHLYFLLEGL